MLDTRTVTLGCLLVWSGIVAGLALLLLAQLLPARDDIGRWGIALVCLSCTYSIHRKLAERDDRLADAFLIGREHERASHLRSVR